MNEIEIKKLVKAEQARALREWRRKNPDKVRAANARYWRKRVLRRQIKPQDKD